MTLTGFVLEKETPFPSLSRHFFPTAANPVAREETSAGFNHKSDSLGRAGSVKPCLLALDPDPGTETAVRHPR